MKNKKLVEFGKSFVGAIIGIILYELIFDFNDPYDEPWKNELADLAFIGICIFVGIWSVKYVVEKTSIFGDKES